MVGPRSVGADGTKPTASRDVAPGAVEAMECRLSHVPKMRNGNDDYIGVMPGESDAPGVEIQSVSATVA